MVAVFIFKLEAPVFLYIKGFCLTRLVIHGV